MKHNNKTRNNSIPLRLILSNPNELCVQLEASVQFK